MATDGKLYRKMAALHQESRELRTALKEVLTMLNKALDMSTPEQVAASGWLGAGVVNSIQRIEEELTKP